MAKRLQYVLMFGLACLAVPYCILAAQTKPKSHPVKQTATTASKKENVVKWTTIGAVVTSGPLEQAKIGMHAADVIH